MATIRGTDDEDNKFGTDSPDVMYGLDDIDDGKLYFDNNGEVAGGRILLAIPSDPRAEFHPAEIREIDINLNY